MPDVAAPRAQQLRSLVTESGALRVSVDEVELAPPGPGQVLVRIEAAPINPSDLGLLLAGADPSSLRSEGDALVADLPEAARRATAARAGTPMPVGNEGAGTVVASGGGEAADALVGRVVAAAGGAMYATHRVLDAAAVLPLPAGVAAAEGASAFVNPLTALGMIETMRTEGHTALVHTAAASNLGQMLVRACAEDGIGLVNVVRSPAQVQLLRGLGAEHVVDTGVGDVHGALVAALRATGATLAFDAIGGGRLASRILAAMEVVAAAAEPYSRYGSSTHKQVYIYGGLDRSPTELTRSWGMAWSVGGWLLTPFLARIGADRAAALRQRVADGIRTTFASTYGRSVGLTEALDPEVARAYASQATGAKALLTPQA